LEKLNDEEALIAEFMKELYPCSLFNEDLPRIERVARNLYQKARAEVWNEVIDTHNSHKASFEAGRQSAQKEIDRLLEKDSMIKQINILLEALPDSEVKEIYERLTGADKEAIEMKPELFKTKTKCKDGNDCSELCYFEREGKCALDKIRYVE